MEGFGGVAVTARLHEVLYHTLEIPNNFISRGGIVVLVVYFVSQQQAESKVCDCWPPALLLSPHPPFRVKRQLFTLYSLNCFIPFNIIYLFIIFRFQDIGWVSPLSLDFVGGRKSFPTIYEKFRDFKGRTLKVGANNHIVYFRQRTLENGKLAPWEGVDVNIVKTLGSVYNFT